MEKPQPRVSREVALLGERVLANFKERDDERAHQLTLAPKREIVEAKQRQYGAYWCNCCQKDYNAVGTKIVEGHGQSMSAVYVSQCPDGHDNYRYITDPNNDPYFIRSHNVQRDRALHADDLLSPHDYRFRTKYREQWLAYEQRRELADTGRDPANQSA